MITAEPNSNFLSSPPITARSEVPSSTDSTEFIDEEQLKYLVTKMQWCIGLLQLEERKIKEYIAQRLPDQVQSFGGTREDLDDGKQCSIWVYKKYSEILKHFANKLYPLIRKNLEPLGFRKVGSSTLNRFIEEFKYEIGRLLGLVNYRASVTKPIAVDVASALGPNPHPDLMDMVKSKLYFFEEFLEPLNAISETKRDIGNDLIYKRA